MALIETADEQLVKVADAVREATHAADAVGWSPKHL
jgi:hypothetical protein